MRKVVVGGTFDLLHKGHRHLLMEADAVGEVKVGLTSDDMAEKTKGVKVEEYEKRKEGVLSVIPEAQVEKIDDPSGFALEEDFDCIIVSPETRARAEEINQKRKDMGKEEMEIKEIDLILAEDGETISSTRIRNGEIDRDGNLINN